MGNVHAGIPEQIVIGLAQLHGATVFVETGTYQGATTRWASRHFEIVHTIERSEKLYGLRSKELARIPNVTPHLGDSRRILPAIVSEIGARRAVYWLDGHWSGGETAGQHDECPVLGELACLSKAGENIILIDDARFFLSAPPRPHDPSQWPTIADIVASLPSSRPSFVQIIDDVIVIIPDSEPLRSHLVAYAQGRADRAHSELSRLQWARLPLKTRLRGRLASIARRISPA